MNVVFDFGAVLFDWQPAELVRQHFPDHAPHTQAANALAANIFRHADWHAFDQGLLDQQEVIKRTVGRLALPEAQVVELVSHIGERLIPIPETLAVLQGLRGLRDAKTLLRGVPFQLYYLSNMPSPYARVLAQRHEFLQWFDGGIYSGDVKLIKPDPAIFDMLGKRHALPAHRTVFIDDLPANVDAARAFGWSAIRFQNAAQLVRALADLGVVIPAA
jgi:putative hydrolase of the HAD superfamily